MNKIVSRVRARRNRMEILRAIDGASSPSMRAELIAISQRQQG